MSPASSVVTSGRSGSGSSLLRGGAISGYVLFDRLVTGGWFLGRDLEPPQDGLQGRIRDEPSSFLTRCQYLTKVRRRSSTYVLAAVPPKGSAAMTKECMINESTIGRHPGEPSDRVPYPPQTYGQPQPFGQPQNDHPYAAPAPGVPQQTSGAAVQPYYRRRRQRTMPSRMPSHTPSRTPSPRPPSTRSSRPAAASAPCCSTACDTGHAVDRLVRLAMITWADGQTPAKKLLGQWWPTRTPASRSIGAGWHYASSASRAARLVVERGHLRGLFLGRLFHDLR